MYSELQSYIEFQILGGGIGPASLFFLFLGGFLASLLPCVYPLYPITAGILSARTTERKWSHPLVYYLGLATMYLFFGLFAGLSGGAFNSFLRFPETNLIFAYILFVLALTSSELLHLPIFSGNRVSASKVSYANSLFLGMGAGLLSSPCVGPVVVAILVKLLTNQSDGFSSIAVISSSLKMFFFGLGLGLPFLLIGVFGFALPKSGKWMRSVQFAVSALILYFSFTYLEKATSLWNLNPNDPILYFFIWCLLLWFSYLATNSEEYLHIRVKKALSISSFFVLLTLLITSILFSGKKYLGLSTETYLSQIHSDTSKEDKSKIQKEVHGNLEWLRNKSDVWELAKKENKPVFVDFYADWCTNCKYFQKLTLSDSKFNLILKDKAILWKIYDTDPIFEEFQSNPNYLELKIGLPFFLVFGPEGKFRYKSTDYLDTIGMIRAIEK